MNVQDYANAVAEGHVLLEKHIDVIDYERVGSSVYRDPSEAHDVDFLVLVHYPMFQSLSQGAMTSFPGYTTVEGQVYLMGANEDVWVSIRKGNVNLIVTTSDEFYRSTLLAQTVCAILKLEDKEDRIKVFAVVQHNLDLPAAEQWVQEWRACRVQN